ncbi:hypothetical protein, partial [Motilibacter deserti]
GTSGALSASVSPNVSGTVTFYRVSAGMRYDLATVAAANGSATASGFFPQGVWSVFAEFVPTDPEFTPSTSSARLVQVLKYPLTIALTSGPSPSSSRAVTVSASYEWNVPGTLRFLAGGVELASVSPATPRGVVTATITLPVGNSRLSATFTPFGGEVVTSNSIQFSILGTGETAAPISVTPATGVRFPVGRSVSTVLASISAPGVPVSSLSAVIEWGDGTFTPGFVAGPTGSPVVFGTHRFVIAPSSVVTVSVVGPDGRYYYNGPVNVLVG